MRSFLLALPLAFVAVTALAQAPAPATPPPPDELPASEVAIPTDGEKSATGLVSKLIRKGNSSEKAAATDVVTVHYTGWSSEGRLFDSSVVRGPASTFPLDKVMAGWRECVQLMTLGEKRRCWIPESLAYKARPDGPRAPLCSTSS
jgi:peptidylprolyl isomerase